MTQAAISPATTASRSAAAGHGRWARMVGWGLPLAALLVLAGCASPPPAPPLLHLPTALDSPVTAGATAPPDAAGPHWRLVTPIALPAALDREAVMVATGPGQWQPWQGLRWAEPLRDALPRVLAHDLSVQRRAPVWDQRPAPGMAVARELRIAITDWEASLPQARVTLGARWALSAPDGRTPTLHGTVSVRQPWQPATPQALAQAQRAALQALAAAILAQTRAP